MSRRNDNKEVAGKKEGKISQRKGGKMLIKGKKKKHEEKFEEKEIKNKIGPKTFDWYSTHFRNFMLYHRASLDEALGTMPSENKNIYF